MIYYKILIDGELLMVSGVSNVREVFQKLTELGEADKDIKEILIQRISEKEASKLLLQITKEEEGFIIG